ncbi:MAG: hypothetical protein ACR2N0_02260 [Rubrobacteraceae bacterium]
MTTKERVLEAIRALPDDVTIENAIEELRRLEQESAVEPEREQAVPAGDAWEILRSLTGALEMPPDWASEHDHYLYGTPKRRSTA